MITGENNEFSDYMKTSMIYASMYIFSIKVWSQTEY